MTGAVVWERAGSREIARESKGGGVAFKKAESNGNANKKI
ncbi:hypothetical protein LSPH26S_04161 [Lysinibacillus sphaericus]